MFRVMMPNKGWQKYDKLLAAIKWCENNIGSSKYPDKNQAWQYRGGVNKYGKPIQRNSKKKINPDKIFVCFAFERKLDAIWFKMVWA